MNLNLRSKSQEDAQPPRIHIILASQSIGRKQLLEKLGIPFRVVVSNVNEEAITSSDPLITLKRRSEAKLNEIIKNPRVFMLDEKVNNLIIAADSMAILGKKTFGKTPEREQTRAALKALMGKTHKFVTSVSAAYIETEKGVTKQWQKTVTTKVTLRKMSPHEVEEYVTRYDFSRYAASYALNEAPWDLVTKIDGSYTNVIGLPFEVLLPILRKYEIIV